MNDEDYPPEIKESNGDIKVLYEKTHNIERLIGMLNDKLTSYCTKTTEFQSEAQKEMGMLSERTKTTKYLVYSALIAAVGALLSTILL